MSRLNGRFMGEDYPTDVLSFPIHASDGVFSCPPDLPECLLGDIMICAEKVLENASEAGHSPLSELSLVLVHGLLHLFGWDHETEEKGSRCGRSRSVIGTEWKITWPPGEKQGQRLNKKGWISR